MAVQLNVLWLWVLLALARAAVLTVSFRRIASHLGDKAPLVAWAPLTSASQSAVARRLKEAIAIAARNAPFEANCFAQAIVACLCLRLRGVPAAVFFGVNHNAQGELEAHAWVLSGPVWVCGGNGFRSFTVVGCFAYPSIES